MSSPSPPWTPSLGNCEPEWTVSPLSCFFSWSIFFLSQPQGRKTNTDIISLRLNLSKDIPGTGKSMDRKWDRKSRCGSQEVTIEWLSLWSPYLYQKIRTTQDTTQELLQRHTHYADRILNWIRRETERPSGTFKRENSVVHIKNDDFANVCRAQVRGFDQKMSEEPVMVKSQILLWCVKSLISSNSNGKTFSCIFFNIENVFPFFNILTLDLSWWLVKKWIVCVPLSIYGDAPFLSKACDSYKQIRLYSLWIPDSSTLHPVRSVHPCSTE